MLSFKATATLLTHLFNFCNWYESTISISFKYCVIIKDRDVWAISRGSIGLREEAQKSLFGQSDH